MMPSQQTQALYSESKQRLSDRIQGSVNNVGSLGRQIVRGSKSADLLNQAIKNFAATESITDSSISNLRRGNLLTNQTKIHLVNMRLPELVNTSAKVDLLLDKYSPDPKEEG